MKNSETTWTIDRIKREVNAAFRCGIPNGWELKWNRELLFQELRNGASPFAVFNVTCFDYSRCMKLIVECPRGDQLVTLTIRYSFIVPAYSLHWTSYNDKNDGRVISNDLAGQPMLYNTVRQLLESKSFFELPPEWHDVKVSGIDLELSEHDKVTLGKCLFEDYSG